jgi:3-oxoacyl-[acyl-carrier protein] reductase/pteridine reductase
MTRALAQSWGPKVTVNSVAPGVIPFGDDVERDPAIPGMIARTPAKRAGTAEDIADAVVFFLSASDFVTGQVLAVDGGLSQR